MLQLESVRNMYKTELIFLLKWDAPQKIFELLLTEYPMVTDYIRSTSTKMTIESFVQIFQEKLLELYNDDGFILKLIEEGRNVISVYTHEENELEWKALYATENSYDLILGGTFRVIMTKEND